MEGILNFIEENAVIFWLVSSLALCFAIVLTGRKIFSLSAGDAYRPKSAFTILPVILWAANTAALGISFIVLAYFTSGRALLNGRAGTRNDYLSYIMLVMLWAVVHLLLMLLSWLGFYRKRKGQSGKVQAAFR
jgi:hypothetical protein